MTLTRTVFLFGILLHWGPESTFLGCDAHNFEERTVTLSTNRLLLFAFLASATVVVRAEGNKIELFNSKDLTGWTAELNQPGAKMVDVWRVENGLLICKGEPRGYIRTKDEYENYVLTLEWRWTPGGKGGNSGVLVHASTPRALGIWPKSIEVQLHATNAGDFWVIGTELDVENEATRKKDRRHFNLTDDSEKPIGEWNQMEITCQADRIDVKVNGQLVNQATNCNVTKGAICLQSEGTEVQFRKVVLQPLAPSARKE